MRKVSLMVLAALVCMALGVGAVAEAPNDSLKLLGRGRRRRTAPSTS